MKKSILNIRHSLSYCLNIILAMGLAVAILPVSTFVYAETSANHITNLGFEDELAGWEVISSVDYVGAIGTEDYTTYDTYADMENTEVNTYKGQQMLRLGMPKTSSEKQRRGDNTVAQTFTSVSDSIKFSFRLFSWEHRGDDSFAFDITNVSGESVGTIEPIVVEMGGGNQIIDTTNRIVWIDAGDRGDWVDTGWVIIEISDIPLNEELTLHYTIMGGQNKAHPTWGYFDNVNSPPIAQFTISPHEPWEGDFIEFMDDSYDPDEPDDEIISWEWNIHWDMDLDNEIDTMTNENGQLEPTEPICGSDLRNPFFIPSDEGKYIVTLYVTDSNGETGQVTKHIMVGNAPPAVNAVSTEVLEGENTQLFGRFIDPGWQDLNHSASWIINNQTITGSVEEVNQAFMSTGIITGTLETSDLPAGTTLHGSLVVYDDSGDYSSNNFTVSIVSQDQTNSEPNDTLITASTLASDNIHLSYIQSTNDLDIYEILTADEKPLPTGSEAFVTLENLPNDYDMLLISQLPEGLDAGGFQMGGYQMGGFQMGGYQMGGYQMGGYQMGGYQMGGFQMGGYQMGGYQMGGYQMGAFQMGGYQMGGYQMGAFQMGGFQMGGFQMGGYQMGGFQMGGYQMGGFQMGAYQMGGYQMGGYQMGGFQMGDGSADYPLSQIIFSGIDGTPNDSISGTDISMSELGFSLEEITEGSEGVFQVVGFTANRGLDEEVLLAKIDTTGTRLFVVVTGANGAFSPNPYSLRIETSQHLDISQILTQGGIQYPSPEGLDYTVTNTVTLGSSNDPKTLFVTQRERMIGRYGEDNWLALKDAIVNLSAHGNIAGDFISVPENLYQVWDSDYSDIDEVNNVVSGIREVINNHLADTNIGYVVIVGNDDIIPFHRDSDLTSIGNERQYAMTSFLRPGSPIYYSLLNGYILTDDYLADELPMLWQGRPSYVPDVSVARLVETPDEIIAAADAFLISDGELAVATALVTGYDFFDDGAKSVINSIKESTGITADALLPSPELWDAADLYTLFLAGESYDINNINAHYTHYSAISAEGFETDNYSDIITSIQVDEANMVDTLVFTMGCHAGLNVPDESAPSPETLGLPINPQLDLPQALNQAILLGSTGFGYGDDEGIGGTEYLMNIFIDQLFASESVGQALVNAKQYFRTSTSTWTAYDEKSSSQFTLYGLPQYTAVSNGDGGGSPDGHDINEPVVLNDVIDPIPVQTSSGLYYTSDGISQSTAFRPVQPKIVIPLDTNRDNPAHGAVITSGFYEDISINPVITRPTNEWELITEEIQLLPPSFWPADLVTINTLESESEFIQTLVVIPGQFLATGTTTSPDGESQIIGTQRLYHDLEIRLTYSSSNDYEAPIVNGIDLSTTETGVNVIVNASDTSGIDQILIHQYNAATHEITQVGSYSTTTPSQGESFNISINDPGADSLIVQVIDSAGNVAIATGKGANLSLINVEITSPDEPTQENTTVTLSAEINDFANLTKPVFYTWDLGDGSFAHGQSVDGSIMVDHIYPDDYPTDGSPDGPSDDFITKLKITDSAGGIGNIVHVVTVEDLAPIVSIDAVTSMANNEGDTVYVDGSFTDIGILDTHTAEIDWGDGTAEDLTITQHSGFGTFSTSHHYLDDPSENAEDVYTISVMVTDKDTLTGEISIGITVFNVNPELVVDNTLPSINEGDSSVINGSFTDVGVLDTHNAEINWGDDSIPEQIQVDETNGSGTLSASHVYLDDPLGEDDDYQLSIELTDKDGGTDNFNTSITVLNVAPTISLEEITNPLFTDVPFTLTGTVFDPGILDIHTAQIDWGDGITETIPLEQINGSGTFTFPHVYAVHGYYNIMLTITDDDLGEGSATQSVKVIARWTDPEDYQDNINGDLIVEMIDNDENTMTITMGVAGVITDEFQYRVKLHIVETNSVSHIKYDNGKVTGVVGAKAFIDLTNPSLLHITFRMDKIGAGSGYHIELTSETQSGIPGAPGAGIPDVMPDEGVFIYKIY
ncbi:hypothetical protein ACFLXP_02270 [Chloroflexota bacterium]